MAGFSRGATCRTETGSCAPPEKSPGPLLFLGGVSAPSPWGVQPKVIYLDFQPQQATELGVTFEAFLATLATQNAVLAARALLLRTLLLRGGLDCLRSGRGPLRHFEAAFADSRQVL